MIPYFIHTNQDAEIIFWNPFLFNNKIEHFSYENIFNLLKIYFINKISENNRYFKNYLYVSGPKENGNIYIMLFKIIIDLNNNFFNLSSMIPTKTRKVLDIKTMNKKMRSEEEKKLTCYLNSIEKTDFYNGNSIINMAKAIIYSLGFVNIELEDQAFFICSKRNTICDKFIDFLELFQITYVTYMKNNHKIYKKNNVNIVSIPGVKQIKMIKKIIDSSRFISFNFSL